MQGAGFDMLRERDHRGFSEMELAEYMQGCGNLVFDGPGKGRATDEKLGKNGKRSNIFPMWRRKVQL